MPAIYVPVVAAAAAADVPPAKTLLGSVADAITLAARQESTSFVAIPSAYGDQNNSPSPGVIVGIVLGSVIGFLLLLYVVYCILHGGLVLIPIRAGGRDDRTGAESTIGASTLGTSTLGTSSYGTRSAMSFRPRKEKDGPRRTSKAPSSRRSRSRTETVEVRTRTRSRRRTAEPVIVDPPRSPSPVSTAPPRAVPASEVSALSSFDEIVVEEDHSPPRRHGSRRYSPDRPGYRRESYVRESGEYYPPRDSPRRGSRRY